MYILTQLGACDTEEAYRQWAAGCLQPEQLVVSIGTTEAHRNTSDSLSSALFQGYAIT